MTPVDGPSASGTVSTAGGSGWGRRIGLAFVFLWFAVGGAAHFLATNLEAKIVPPYLPWHRAIVLVTGAFELLGAAGLLYRPTRRAAGIGLFVLTLLVTPANIYMLQRPDLFGIPLWILVARLPLQLALLAVIAWSTMIPDGGRGPSSR